MRIVFMGSAEFGVPALAKLLAHHTVCSVVTTPPKPQGRGLKPADSPIAVFAEQNGIASVLKPMDLKSGEVREQLSEFKADIFIVVAFRILPKSLFSLPPLGTVNIHASLLPKYRGPAPIQRAIAAGERETGVTVFRIDEGVDTGELILQQRLAIGEDETTPQLYDRLGLLGADLLLKALDGISAKTLMPLPQDSGVASRAPKLRKEEALIDWNKSATSIFNEIRAFKPFPGTYTIINGKRLGIENAMPVLAGPGGGVGTISRVGPDFLEINCGQGSLRVIAVKPEGRKSMTVHDFLLGTKLTEGTRCTWTHEN